MFRHDRAGLRDGKRDSNSVLWATVVILLILGLVLRWRLIDRPMRYDEAFTVWRYARNGWWIAMSDYSLPNNHVLHTIAVAVWGKLSGFGPEAVRTPALVAGMALVPAGFLAASRLAGRGAGLLTAAMLAASPIMVDASVEARGYTMAALAAVVSVWLATHILEDPRRRLPWAGLVVTAALGLWAVPVFAYPLAALAVWLALPRSDGPMMASRTAVALGATGLLTALLYWPILSDDPDSLLSNRFVAPDPLLPFLRQLPGVIGDVAAGWTWRVWAPAAVVLIGGIAAALWPDSRRSETIRLAWAALVGPAVMLLVHHAVPYPRNFLPLYPLAVIMACSGLARLGHAFGKVQHRWFAAAAALTLILAAPSAGVSDSDLPPGRSGEFMGASPAADFLAVRADRDDRVVAPIPASAPLRYYRFLHGPDPPADGREDIYLVIPDERSLQDGIVEADLDPSTDPEILRRVEDGTIYVVPAAT